MANSKVYPNYINGEWVESSSKRVFENNNPADKNDLIGIFQESNQEDLNRAVAAAKAAYNSWRLVPPPRRAEILYRAAEILVKKKEEFARDMTREMGKVLNEARGDVQEAIDMTYYMAGEGRRLFGETVPAELPNKFAMSIRMPLGVCGIITPWNFPMAIPSWKIMPALICGNTVVFKPASDTPLSAYNLIRTLEEAGIPKGVVNLVAGGGREIGVPLTQHPDISVISFTGSTAVGRGVAENCAASFKRHILEMGGKNVILVMEDANIDLAVEGAVWGGFGTTGQRCTASSRVVVHKDIYDAFAERFVDATKSLRVGSGLNPSIDVGPLINQAQLNNVEKYIDIGLKEGAKLLTGGKPLNGGQYSKGFFYPPTIFGDVDAKMRIAQEEIFGPVVCVISCQSLAHAIEIGNSVVYGLSSAIYTQDINKAFTAMRDMYTGIFYVNASTIGSEVQLPFGGTKQTGNGHREAGQAALDVFSEWKSIYVDYSGRLQRAQIDR